MGDCWRPIEYAPKSVADGRHITGIYLLGYVPDADEPEGEQFVDIIWWEPLQRNRNGGLGKWCASSFGESIEVKPTHWMPLPSPPEQPK